MKLYLKKGADLNLIFLYAKELAILAFNNHDIPDILVDSTLTWTSNARLTCTSKGGYYAKSDEEEYLYPELLDLRTECSPPQSDYRCIFIKSPWQKKLKKDCFFIREDANFYEITYIDNNNEECKKQVPLDSFDNFNLDSSFDDIHDCEKTVFGQYQPAFINKILELTHLPLKEKNVLSIPIKFDQMATQLELVQKIMHRIAAIKNTAYGNAEDKQNKMDAPIVLLLRCLRILRNLFGKSLNYGKVQPLMELTIGKFAHLIEGLLNPMEFLVGHLKFIIKCIKR